MLAHCPMVDASRFAFLPSDSTVHECARRNRTHGGVLVVPRFLETSEVTFLSDLSDSRMHREPTWWRLTNNGSMFAKLNYSMTDASLQVPCRGSHRCCTQRQRTKWAALRRLSASRHVRAQSDGQRSAVCSPAERIAERLSALPGHPAGRYHDFRARLPTIEPLWLTATGNVTDDLLNPHHDRNTYRHLFLTAIVYLAHSGPILGGHTIFPCLALLPKRRWPSDALLQAGELARRAIVRRWSAIVQDFRKKRSRNLNVGGISAARTLCAAVARAEQLGTTPPCLAVHPSAGTAVLYWHWGWDGQQDVEEWRNLHLPCPVLNGQRRLALQSFRIATKARRNLKGRT